MAGNGEIHEQSMLLGELSSDVKTLYRKIDDVIKNQHERKHTEEGFKREIIQRIDTLEVNMYAGKWWRRGWLAGLAAASGVVGAKLSAILTMLIGK